MWEEKRQKPVVASSCKDELANWDSASQKRDVRAWFVRSRGIEL